MVVVVVGSAGGGGDEGWGGGRWIAWIASGGISSSPLLLGVFFLFLLRGMEWPGRERHSRIRGMMKNACNVMEFQRSTGLALLSVLSAPIDDDERVNSHEPLMQDDRKIDNNSIPLPSSRGNLFIASLPHRDTHRVGWLAGLLAC